tara:strand:- start:1382 stop:1501 length:120 start_codon:yes stop_codon:yes gene_type:complete
MLSSTNVMQPTLTMLSDDKNGYHFPENAFASVFSASHTL